MIITKRFLIWIQRKHTISYDQNARQFTPTDNIVDDDQRLTNKILIKENKRKSDGEDQSKSRRREHFPLCLKLNHGKKDIPLNSYNHFN